MPRALHLQCFSPRASGKALPEFISSAVHRWELAGRIYHVKLSCGLSNQLTAILLCHF